MKRDLLVECTQAGPASAKAAGNYLAGPPRRRPAGALRSSQSARAGISTHVQNFFISWANIMRVAGDLESTRPPPGEGPARRSPVTAHSLITRRARPGWAPWQYGWSVCSPCAARPRGRDGMLVRLAVTPGRSLILKQGSGLRQ